MPNDKLTQLAEAFRDDIAIELGIDPDKLPNKIGRAVVDILKGWDAYEWEEAATMLPELATVGWDRANDNRDDALARFNEYREERHLPAIEYDGANYADADPESLRHTRAGAVTAWAERLGMDVRQVVAAPADRTVVWLLVGDDS